jgi:membrane protein
MITKKKLKDFYKKELQYRVEDITQEASSLSFYTIFSMVPILLIVLSIFSSTPMFNTYYKKIESFMISNILPTNQDIVLEYIQGFFSNSSSMGIMGGIYVFITSILFFNNYEAIINKIFKSKKRDVWNRIMTYWTMMTLFPLLFSFSIFISIKIQKILDSTDYTKWIDFIAVFPFLIIWALFFLAYKLSPNKKLSTRIVLITSVIVTTIFTISKQVFVYYVLHNQTYDSLYGSFSVVLFIFLWIYVSWIIFLSGAYFCDFLDTISIKKEGQEMDLSKISIGSNPDKLNAVIEIPFGSNIKYEIDKDSGAVFVDRVMYSSYYYPANYGFIPNTLAADGDPVDILVVNEYELVPGCVIPVRLIGVLIMEDEAGMDEKLLAVPVTKIDPTYEEIKTYEDLPKATLNKIQNFFDTYKALEPNKWVKVKGFEGIEKAKEIVEDSIKAAQK